MVSDGKRALAYIVTIDEIRPIANYDRVVHARTNGWWCVVRKDEFNVGDRAIYFEIDSKVPETDERFAFLESKHYKIKTQKMCKVLSQGLLMPANLFTEVNDLDIGADVTDLLGVKYYVPEDNARKAAKPDPKAKYKSMAARHKELFRKPFIRKLMKREWGRKLLFFFFGRKKDKPLAFPTKFPYVHKTDEERIENMPWVLGSPNAFTVTEKADGSSATYILERKGKKKFEFYVLSRNVRQLTPDQEFYHDENIYWNNAFKYDIENVLKSYLSAFPELDYVCIQGESVGKVQGNPLKLDEDDLYIFNFIRSDRGRLPSVEAKEIVESLGMKFVPILDTNYHIPNDMETFKKYATAPSAINPNVLREGVVLRDPTNDMSFKNVSNEYLLKHHS